MFNRIKRWNRRRRRARFARYPNILETDIRLPQTVYIVAGGPNGVAHYHQIPEDGYVIATNKSVLNPAVRPDMWMLNSTSRDVLPWIDEASRSFSGVRVFRKYGMKNLPGKVAQKGFFVFAPQGGTKNKNRQRQPGCVFSGGTVSGFAIQVAAHLGAREIVLCGVDMSGALYWDGTTNKGPKHGELWHNADAVNRIIESLHNEYDLSIRSLSPTRLNVPVS